MTQFKVGDRVKLIKEFGGWCNTNVGKEGVVIFTPNAQSEWARVKFDNSEGKVYETDYGDPSCLNPISTTPPETIQHEGYNYTRGEPVVPEWVKDGAWVVHKETGKIGKVSKAHTAYFNPLDKTFRVNFSNHLVADDFRPFTDADWEWGMWAEYKGEKVFVMSGKDGGGVFASRPTNTYFFALFSEITPTTAP